MRLTWCLVTFLAAIHIAILPANVAANPGGTTELKGSKSAKSNKARAKNSAARTEQSAEVPAKPFPIPAADGPASADQPGQSQAGKAVPPVWPKTLDDAAPAPPPPPAWTEQEISSAKAECTEILKRIDAVAIPEAPIREGICGTPAPIQLISIGKNPEVALSPPAIITCQMAEMLHSWLKNDLQPLAMKRLGSEIIRIQTMSSYQCRMAYGRSKNKLSEHGVANALDIGAFTLASGKTANVLKDWGPNNRDIAAAVAAEKAAALAEEAKRSAAAGSETAQGSSAANPTVAAPDNPNVAGTVVIIPKAGSPGRDERFGLGFAPSRLGGPGSGKKRAEQDGSSSDATIYFKPGNYKDGAANGVITPADQPKAKRKSAKAMIDPLADGGIARTDGRMAFLKDAHGAACGLFGTTLGPEANEAHRNHFHVDMAPRKFKKICD